MNAHEVNNENMKDDVKNVFELQDAADEMTDTELQTTIKLRIESLNSSNEEQQVAQMNEIQTKTEAKYKPKKVQTRKVLQLSNRRRK